MRTEVFKDTRLLDALEYIDDEYIASAAGYKMKYTEQPHEHKMTWRTPLKHWKQFVALAASLILLSAAFPTIVRFVSTTIDFLAGRGGGTTEELSENIFENNINENTSELINDTTDNYIDQSTDAVETQIPDAILIPNYLEFDPPLEPISQELMLEIREAWAKKQYEDTYKDYYGLHIAAGYTEEEAVKIATENAEKVANNGEYAWFVLYLLNGTNRPLAWYYRYYGMIGDHVVLSTYIDSGFAPYGGFTIGEYEFAYPNGGTIYLYKDGVFASFEDAFNEGLITKEHVALIHGRYKEYESVFDKWYRAELEKYYESKGET